MSQSPRYTLHFASFHLSSDIDLLYHGQEVVALEPQAARVLRYLVEHHERVVSKEELLERIWPDVFTTDDVLKKAVSQARRALGDDAHESRFIQTYHGRGYRFIAPVTRSAVTESKVPDASNGAAYTFLPAAPFNAHQSAPLHSDASTRERWASKPSATARDPDYDQLIGRDVELQMLHTEYRRALEGAARPVLLVGEPGIGKTQLARYFGRWAHEQGARCFYTRFFDYEGSRLAPYEVFLGFLRDVLCAAAALTDKERGGAAVNNNCDMRALAKSRWRIALPAELFAGATPALHPAKIRVDAGATSTAAASSAGANFRAIVPLSDCFVRLSRERPLLMIFDDIQWADEASRDVIGYLMRTAHSEPLMILALARTEATNDPNHPLANWLKQQSVYRSLTSQILKPLNDVACGSAIEAMFGGKSKSFNIPHTDQQTLYRVTEGNPYFLTEMLRLLIAEGAISHEGSHDATWQWHGIKDIYLPQTLVMAARAKLDLLSPSVREMAEHAAVIGEEFRVETLAHLTGKNEAQTEELLREGLRLGVLSERDLSANEDYRFYHTILRRVLYDELPQRRRKRLHAQAAHALATVYAREADRVAEAVSAHYEAAGDWRRSFEWSMRAWAIASGRGQWSEAAASIDRAHAAARECDRLRKDEPSSPERLKLLLAMGEGYYSVGRMKESESALEEAVAFARASDDQATLAAALLQQGRTCVGLSRMYCEANAPVEKALEIYRRLSDQEGTTLALVELGSIQSKMGNYEAAAQLCEQVLDSTSPMGHSAAVACGILGWARVLQGNYDKGLPMLERALGYMDRVGDVRQRALTLRHLQWAHQSRGEYEKAINVAVRARADFRAISDTLNEALSMMGIGQARIGQGLIEEGIEFLNRALDVISITGAAHAKAETLWLLGRAHCEAHRSAQAAELLEQSLKMVREIGDRDDEFRILTDIARLKLSDEDGADALRAADQAARIAEELDNSAGLGAALVERARAHLMLKQPQRALKAAELAVKLLEETGAGERWRGYWTLAQALDTSNKSKKFPNDERALAALRQSVGLLDKMREQLFASDAVRRTNFTRARSAPARDLHAKLLRSGHTAEAKDVARKWLLDETKVVIQMRK